MIPDGSFDGTFKNVEGMAPIKQTINIYHFPALFVPINLHLRSAIYLR